MHQSLQIRSAPSVHMLWRVFGDGQLLPWNLHIPVYHGFYWRLTEGDGVAEWLRNWNQDREVVGSNRCSGIPVVTSAPHPVQPLLTSTPPSPLHPPSHPPTPPPPPQLTHPSLCTFNGQISMRTIKLIKRNFTP